MRLLITKVNGGPAMRRLVMMSSMAMARGRFGLIATKTEGQHGGTGKS